MYKTIATNPFEGQKPGTSGLRKKVKQFMETNYLENFVQSIFNSVEKIEGSTIVVGGDGRYYNDVAIQTIIKIAKANGVKKLIIGKDGILSTPAASNLIRKYKTDGGIILSASHNPAGINEDFGIKFNGANGGPAPDKFNAKIYSNTLNITEYKIVETNDVDLSKMGVTEVEGMIVEIIDPVADYLELMEELFDFDAIEKMFKDGFEIRFDAMHAVTGPYGEAIFEKRLGAEKGSVINKIPLDDFGGGHPDPNLIYAKELVKYMASDDAANLGAASDGDGDRNMILGEDFFVTPNDSLAIILEHAELIPAYRGKVFGVARSLPTSSAVDKVAEAKGIKSYETPTGWKYFGNLMDSDLITFCGEESFGTGSNHVREKDGIWAVLCWLNILAKTGKSVKEITNEFWEKYGRSYYLRYDYEGIDSKIGDDIMLSLENSFSHIIGNKYEDYEIISAEPFYYKDPVDGSETKNGLTVNFNNGSRIIYRLSGTGTSGATLRVYVEKYVSNDGNLYADPKKELLELNEIAEALANIVEKTGKYQADVIT